MSMREHFNSFKPAAWNIFGVILAVIIASVSGCVLVRGRNFGHWAQSGEKIDLIRYTIPAPDPKMPDGITIAILPAISDMSQPFLNTLNNNILQQARVYVPANILEVAPDGKFKEYVTKDNLMPISGVFNSQEAGRLGQILGVSHILCCHVQNYRLDPPQILSLHFILVDTASFKIITEMTADFDASEQVTAIILDRYLRSRSNRPYNITNFDIILRSPAQYSAFVAAECMYSLADRLWKRSKN